MNRVKRIESEKTIVSSIKQAKKSKKESSKKILLQVVLDYY